MRGLVLLLSANRLYSVEGVSSRALPGDGARHRYFLRELKPRSGIVEKEMDAGAGLFLTRAGERDTATFEADVPVSLNRDLSDYLLGRLGEGVFLMIEDDDRMIWTLVPLGELIPRPHEALRG